VVAHQARRSDVAVELIGRAIGVNATVAAYHSNHGIVLRDLGRIDDALAAYDAALRIQPDFAEALCNRGVALNDLGRAVDALGDFDAALRIRPHYPEALLNRGNALKDLGRIEDALDAYDAALRLRPTFAEALCGRGVALHDLGRAADALGAYDAALSARPDYPEAHLNRGNALKDLGRIEDALAAYDAALRVRPDDAQALFNRGVALKSLGRADEALAAYDGVLRIGPDNIEALCNRGAILRDLDRFEEALAAYDAALRIRPHFAAALFNRGVALTDLGRVADALLAYDEALRIEPDDPEILRNRGAALYELGRLDEAVGAYDAALRVRPDFAEAHYDRGVALKDLSRIEDAIDAYNAALGVRPDYVEALYNLSFLHLLRGDLKEGLEKYEMRQSASKHLKPRGFAQPQWQGEDLAGRTILLHAEQGLGDTIQFCRYVALAARRGGRVALEAPAMLRRLLSGLEGVDQWVNTGESLPAFDLHCPLLSLPLALGTTLDTIPADVPYLSAEPDRVSFWRDRLGSRGFRIGVVWRGGPAYTRDSQRSVPLSSFAPLAALPGVRLISLQKQHGLEELEHLPIGMTVETLGDDFDAGPDAFLDTAAVIANLDLVATVDTAVGHLAGALGRPVWFALSSAPHWVWMLGRSDSPWYPTARLFRQPRDGDWDSVFAAMAAGLIDHLKGRSPLLADQHPPSPPGAVVTAPVSVGELIDKVTILEIKAARIDDPAANRNVIQELNLLKETLAGQPDPPELAGLISEMRSVNQALWDIEDAVRNCERQGDFGPRFVELARSVYRTNDRRAAIKKEINRLMGSRLTEEKSYSAY
jgi:tetratricopeptide (TPR) repeat protein